MKFEKVTLEKTKFFTTDGTDIWYVRSVKTMTAIRMENTSTGELEDVIAGDDSRFEPCRVVIDKPAERKKAMTKTAPTASQTKLTSGGSKKSGSKSKSKYKGVCPTRPMKDGTFKWRAQFWDGKKNKLIGLGQFDTEELAAAAYADYKGDKAEAQRLRGLALQADADMAEQAENNPDRPPKKTKRKMAWECQHCKLSFQSKPTSCPGCNSASFKEVPDDE